MDDSRMQHRVIVQFNSGETMLVKGVDIQSLATQIIEARASGLDFLFIQETHFGDDGVAIDPNRVEALIRVNV